MAVASLDHQEIMQMKAQEDTKELYRPDGDALLKYLDIDPPQDRALGPRKFRTA